MNDEMKLRIIPTSEGYFDALRNRYFYNYTDHLGNVRLSYSDADGNGIVTGDILVNNCFDTPDGQICNNYIITGEAEGVTNYYPFGLMHNNENHSFDQAYQYKYNGKELQETGMYDYGARFYMPDLVRWGVVDPLAEKMTSYSPYNYAFNNPVRFIDPDGRAPFTDYTFNRKTGEVKQVGETNNLPDRILKTEKDGSIATKKGEVKVEVDNIAKGILKDGQNLKTNDNVIDIGGKGQPTLQEFEEFAVKISDYIGVELTGAYLSQDANENGVISKIYLDKYKNNTISHSVGSLYRFNIGDPEFDGYFKNTDFHTHPTMGYSRDSIENPSSSDLRSRDKFKNDFYKFIILTKQSNYPYNVQKIDYTKY